MGISKLLSIAKYIFSPALPRYCGSTKEKSSISMKNASAISMEIALTRQIAVGSVDSLIIIIL